jgi:hypothetical protein
LHLFLYVFARLLLWFIAVIIALFPTVMSSKQEFVFDFYGELIRINEDGLFRDLFFALVPTSAIAISTLLDYMIMCHKKISGSVQTLSVIGLIVNVAALASGLSGFLNIERDEVLADHKFHLFTWILCLSIGVSLISELTVSCGHGSVHLVEK